MKTLILILLLASSFATAQDMNTLRIDERNNKPYLIGYCDRTAFADSNFAWWFNSAYDNYDVDSAALLPISGDSLNLNLIIVMGTWCSDSKREVPRFYKILDYLHYPENNVTLINVDRKKAALENEIDRLEIKLVPTFIFFDTEGTEIGRIIESPEESLETDLVKILQNNF